MNIVGIIAEYNPFHSGHAYQIRRAKELADADYAIVILSGDFVQRGEPGIYDKYTRTKDALDGGADIVFELPVRFCVSSAGDFAYGGVKALTELGFVTHICFGSEGGDIDTFLEIAKVLDRVDTTRSAFHDMLDERLREGLSYPDARAGALLSVIGQSTIEEPFLSMPNNILGIEYCLALRKISSPLIPLTLLREGQDYRDSTNPSLKRYPSSTAIRAGITQSNTPHLVLDDFSDVIAYALRDTIRSEGNLNNHHEVIDTGDDKVAKDMSRDLYARVKKHTDEFISVSDLVDKVKTRAFTESRIRRSLLQCMLRLTKTDTAMPYLHLLGLNTRAGHLLKNIRGANIEKQQLTSELLQSDITIKKEGSDDELQIITRLAADLPKLSKHARDLYEEDLFAADIYRQIFQRKYRVTLPNEYKQTPVIIDRAPSEDAYW